VENIDAAIDYYEVLQVAATASPEEVRRSFKKLVLESHPDKNPGRREWSERRIRELIRAYEILGDPDRRRTFDRMRRLRGGGRGKVVRPSEPFFFRKKGPGARALMILHLMLNRDRRQAVDLLREMEVEHGFDFLSEYLERRDHLDCLFLLAEYHLERKEYAEAATRLKSFYRLERKSKFRRHYYSEVVRLLKDLYLRKLPRAVSPGEALVFLREAVELQLTPQEDLLRLKKVAETQARLGDLQEARRTLTEIQGRDPKAKGLERLEALLAAG